MQIVRFEYAFLRVLLLPLLLALWGCAAHRPVEVRPLEPVRLPAVLDADGPRETEPEPRGVSHVVAAGQTLWRIARAYGLGVEELAAINGLDDPERLETGQVLWIPGAARTLDVAPWPQPLGTGVPADEPGAVVAFDWPIPGGALLSPFGAPRRARRHAGVDIRGRHGEPVLAAREGRVVFTGDRAGYGRTVILEHGDGLRSLYAHNSALLVAEGDWVERGQPIARVGRTGNATAEHCHFEIRRDGVPVDPLSLLPALAEAAR